MRVYRCQEAFGAGEQRNKASGTELQHLGDERRRPGPASKGKRELGLYEEEAGALEYLQGACAEGEGWGKSSGEEVLWSIIGESILLSILYLYNDLPCPCKMSCPKYACRNSREWKYLHVGMSDVTDREHWSAPAESCAPDGAQVYKQTYFPWMPLRACSGSQQTLTGGPSVSV